MKARDMEEEIRLFIEQFFNSEISDLLESSNNNVDLVVKALRSAINDYNSPSQFQELKAGRELLATSESFIEYAIKNSDFISPKINEKIKSEASLYLVSLIKAYIEKPSQNFSQIISDGRIKLGSEVKTQNSSKMLMTLFVKDLSGNQYKIKASMSDTIYNLKKQLQQVDGGCRLTGNP